MARMQPRTIGELWRQFSRCTMFAMLQGASKILSDRALRVLTVVLFALWLVSWGYTASKMLVFSGHTYRNLTLPLSLLCVDLWALCFAIGAKRRFSVEKSPIEAALAKASTIPSPLRLLVRLGWWTPLCFSGFMTLFYLIYTVFSPMTHPDWPSPVLPACITFSPMVFFFGLSSVKMRTFQDNLANNCSAAGNLPK